MEYYIYKPDKIWCIKELIKVMIMCVMVALLLYNKIYVSPLLFPVGVYLWRNDRNRYKKQVQDKLRHEFKEFIILLSGSLNAGYSLEQGIKRSYDDMVKDRDFSLMPKELSLIINGLSLNKDVEQLLMDMGERCGEERMIEFAKLVATAKKYGGNINLLIDKTKTKLNDKLLVEKEIDTLVAAKKLEGYLMLLMPFGIMLYMRFTNGSYINLLYDSLMGNVIVTIALIIVLVCGFIIKRITEIEV